MAQDPPGDRTPIVFKPETFARHAGAVRYVEGLIRTRAPRPSTGRFPGLAMGAWGLLASGGTISAGSGLSLGSGTVKLCTRDGGTLTDTGEVVTVYNSGRAITAAGSALAVALEWTGAGWSACSCETPVVEHVPCPGCPIPKKDLAVTIFPVIGSSYGWPMVYDGVATWDSGCVAHFATGHFRTVLNCTGGFASFQWGSYLAGCVIGGIFCSNTSPTTLRVDIPKTTCDPYHLRLIPAPPLTDCGGALAFEIDG